MERAQAEDENPAASRTARRVGKKDDGRLTKDERKGYDAECGNQGSNLKDRYDEAVFWFGLIYSFGVGIIFEDMHNSQDLVEQLGRLAERYHLVAVYVFGSRSKEILTRLDGETAESEFPDSDVDIGVLPDRRHGLRVDERVALMLALEDLFEVKLLSGEAF